ncbi:hypothetical protein UA70_02285 [Raoultella planticola]|nr:hypothetical protein UA70_02285 [Raoultella planticola]
MTRIFLLIAGQGDAGKRWLAPTFVVARTAEYSVHHESRVFLFPALQVNGPGPVSPALRQEIVATRYLRLRRLAVRDAL